MTKMTYYKKQIWISLLLIIFVSSSASGEPVSPAQKKYYETAACYKGLRKNPVKQQYRDEWLKCIHSSEDIYKLDPNGSWATAGLYLTGHLYDRLYRHTHKKNDYQKAELYFHKLLKRFPSSKYRERTFKALHELHTKNPIFADFHMECLRPQKKAITNVAKEKEARGKYFKAEYCATNIPNRSSETEWLRCVQRFYEVYQCDPDGRWAAAGLFQTAILYRELYHHTQKQQYADQSENLLKQILKQFPESVYCGKSAETIEEYYLKNPPKISLIPSVTLTPSDKIEPLRKKNSQIYHPEPQNISAESEKDAGARDRYFRAESCYKNLIRENSNHEEEWYACISTFIEAYTFDPKGRWAAAALFRAGRLNQECYRRFGQIRYLNEAEDYFRRIINHFPESDYITKTKKLIQKIQILKMKVLQSTSKSKKKLIKKESQKTAPESPVKKIAKKPEITKASAYTLIQKITWETKSAHTRIIVRTNQRVEYSQYLRKEENNKPECLFVDFERTILSEQIPKYFSIHDSLVNDLRILEKEDHQIRVALQLNSYHHYKIYSLKNPQRVIIDIWSQSKKKLTKNGHGNGLNADYLKNGAIARQLALGIKRIVIDAGHGGKDGGAVGFFKGVYEKDIVLSIAKRLEQKILQHIQCEVILTRSNDHFLPLDKRSDIANSNKADLFISIHTNAHPNHSVYGIETYYLNLTTDDDAIRVAALENEVSGKKMSDLDTILHDLMQNAKINESSRLAGHVQNSVFQHLKKYYQFIKDNGVKQAPFYVLMGAEMPAILIEIGFISNQRDCRRMTNPAFQNHLCDAIVKGINDYIKITSAQP
ncbi:cell wall hydrolase [Candidatus Magnetomorum sp. HK-1]|nr:cell wall hydrolase [Candidatus Magnetomorum sp. HK-1]